MTLDEMHTSLKHPIYVYELIRSESNPSFGRVPEQPVKVYKSVLDLYKDVCSGIFEELDKNNITDSFLKKQSPYSYESYVVFVDGKTSSKYKWKHDYLIRIPRPNTL